MDYIDLLFAGRNKAYGAYALRRAYGQHMRQACFSMLGLVCVLLWALHWSWEPTPPAAIPARANQPTIVCICLGNLKIEEAPVRRPAPPLPAGKRYWPVRQSSWFAFVPPIVLEDTIVLDEYYDLPPKRARKIALFNAPATADGFPADTLRPVGMVPDSLHGVDTSADFEAVAEHVPVFPGGDTALHAYLRENLRWPDPGRPCYPTLVVVSFIVDHYGDVVEPAVVYNRSGNPAYADEALRVVRSMPCWIMGPARRVRMTLPVRFQ